MSRDEKHRILIVEDDQIFRELLVVALTLRGYVVYVAEDGQRAMTVIKNARPHLVTVDLRMPRTDGLRFLEWLRGTRRFGSVPAIVVTAVDDKGTAVDALVSGASDVLTKPVDLDVLAARIESLLADRDSRAEDTGDDGAEEGEVPASVEAEGKGETVGADADAGDSTAAREDSAVDPLPDAPDSHETADCQEARNEEGAAVTERTHE